MLASSCRSMIIYHGTKNLEECVRLLKTRFFISYLFLAVHVILLNKSYMYIMIITCAISVLIEPVASVLICPEIGEWGFFMKISWNVLFLGFVPHPKKSAYFDIWASKHSSRSAYFLLFGLWVLISFFIVTSLVTDFIALCNSFFDRTVLLVFWLNKWFRKLLTCQSVQCYRSGAQLEIMGWGVPTRCLNWSYLVSIS